jgi:hypothetical protein
VEGWRGNDEKEKAFEKVERLFDDQRLVENQNLNLSLS